MKIIVGLGNPGKAYEKTRHNAGFMAVDFFISNSGFKIEDFMFSNPYDAFILEANLDQSEIVHGLSHLLFVKPSSFMNKSGEVVKAICNFYKEVAITTDLLIIHDDKDLPLGTIKAMDNSSSAGHNGVQNIIDVLGTQNFHRIRIGISLPDNQLPTDAFVLQSFSPDELNKLQTEVLPQVKLEIENFIK